MHEGEVNIAAFFHLANAFQIFYHRGHRVILRTQRIIVGYAELSFGWIPPLPRMSYLLWEWDDDYNSFGA